MPELVDLTGDTSDEDEDLRLAISMSLQDQDGSERSSPCTHQPIRNLIDPQPVMHSSSVPSMQSSRESNPIEPNGISTTGISGLDRKQMELDRVARLKRKRPEEFTERSVSPPPIRRRPSPSLVEYSLRQKPETEPASGNTSKKFDLSHAMSNPPMEDISSSTQDLNFPFLTGRVLLTSERPSHNLAGDSLPLRDLLKPVTSGSGKAAPLKSAFLSTFISDFDWLLPHFDTRLVSFVFALHAANERHQRELKQDFHGIHNVRLVFPMVGKGVNCMHSKLMLLFYEGANGAHARCRVVVPSANLVPWDWGVGDVMENVFFVADLPQTKTTRETVLEIPFKTNLLRQLNEMDVPADVVRKLDNFSFEGIRQVGFVHTIGGHHVAPLSHPAANPSIGRFFNSTSDEKSASGSSSSSKYAAARTNNSHDSPPTTPMLPTGLLSLSQTIEDLGLQLEPKDPEYPPQVDYVTSSLGNLNDAFMGQLQSTILGRAHTNPASLVPVKITTSAATASKESNQDGIAQFKENLRIYFPSEDSVRSSRGGPQSAGTICFRSNWWNGTTASGKVKGKDNNIDKDAKSGSGSDTEFPKSAMTDCVGVRGDGMLMHSKILYVRFRRPKLAVRRQDSVDGTRPSDQDNQYYAGWAYVGSANLSESAWGKVTVDSKDKTQLKLSCRNWESGIVIPVPWRGEVESVGRDMPNSVFVSKVDQKSDQPPCQQSRVGKSADQGPPIDPVIEGSPATQPLRHVFSNVVPVPMQFPGCNLLETQREPWFFSGIERKR